MALVVNTFILAPLIFNFQSYNIKIIIMLRCENEKTDFYNPIIIAKTNPLNGYKSISTCDLNYLGFNFDRIPKSFLEKFLCLALELFEAVKMELDSGGTVWSVVYNLDKLTAKYSVYGNYEKTYSFKL
jgi:hypothetical protein